MPTTLNKFPFGIIHLSPHTDERGRS